jgi:hypothetical protein
MGLIACLSDASKLATGYAFAFFAISAPVGVIGVPQIREAFAEMRRRGSHILAQKEDLTTFYFPAWGRMLVWFVSCAVSGLSLKALGLCNG